MRAWVGDAVSINPCLQAVNLPPQSVSSGNTLTCEDTEWTLVINQGHDELAFTQGPHSHTHTVICLTVHTI